MSDVGDDGSARQATARYSDPDSLMINSSTSAGPRSGFNQNNNNGDHHLRHRLLCYETQMTPPWASKSLVNEGAVEIRRLTALTYLKG